MRKDNTLDDKKACNSEGDITYYSLKKYLEESVKEYCTNKGNNHHVIFLVDEVGQYAGTDSKALLNLQTMVENLGLECGGKAWVCVTSQEAIDEVVKVHSDNFSKIQGRFATRLLMSSSNADEVIKSYLAGTLAEVGEATCDHHDHEHQGAHDCGHGGCQH